VTELDEREVQRLRWQCRRGMLELDLLLERFLTRRYVELDLAQREAFERLLGFEDQILHDWLIGRAVPADSELSRLAELIRAAMR
jgi:antitoxin CptB